MGNGNLKVIDKEEPQELDWTMKNVWYGSGELEWGRNISPNVSVPCFSSGQMTGALVLCYRIACHDKLAPVVPRGKGSAFFVDDRLDYTASAHISVFYFSCAFD